MRVFNQATEAVKQGGTRRGANMGVLRIDHPDILDFIRCKADGDFANFNISVALTEKFMEAVKAGTTYDLINPRDKEPSPASSTRARSTTSSSRWRGRRATPASSSSTASTATTRRRSSARSSPRTRAASSRCSRTRRATSARSTCPGSCGPPRTGPDVDWDHLADVVHRGVRFLDDVIEVNDYPLPQIGELARGNRKIGLGVMGWADMLIKMDIAYDSEEGVALGEKVMGFIDAEAKSASRKLAEERGAFPNFAGSIYDTPEGGRDPQRDGHHHRADRHAVDHRQLLRRASSRCSRSPTCARSWTTIAWSRSTRCSRRSRSSAASTAASSCS